MKKVLWVSDGFAPTGFSRVAHNLIKRAPDDFEIHHLAINYYGDPHNFSHKMYPAACPNGDVYGFRRLPTLVNKIKPDILFLFNDINIINRYLLELLKNKIENLPVYVYYPVDSKYIDRDYFSLYPKYVKKVFTYTDFAVKETKRSFNINDIKIVPHGIDSAFYTLPKKEVNLFRKKLTGIDNPFIVLNANRNQPRKRIDITIRAFAEFAKDKEDVRLYLHMGVIDAGWNIIKLAERFGIDNKLIITSTNRGLQAVKDEVLNKIYNAADVGINTSEGEGFGLTNFEMGSLGIPQVVPNNSASGELFGDIGVTVEPKYEIIAVGTNTEFSVVDYRDVADALNKLYYDRKYREEVGSKTKEKFRSDYFNWDRIAKDFWSEF